MHGSFEALVDVLSKADRVLLTGPSAPDGDSIGACLALQRLLAEQGVAADVAGDPGFRYDWMPAADRMIPDNAIEPSYGAVVILDGDRHRLLQRTDAAFQAAAVRAIVDHHASTSADGYTHAWLEPHATSTCEMLYQAAVADEVPLDADLAAQLYVGAIFDTGGFRYSNTTPATHRMAAALLATGIDHAQVCARVLMERRDAGLRLAGAVFTSARAEHGGALSLGRVELALAKRLGARMGDLEGIVDQLLFVHGVEVAVLLIERRQGRQVKISLRSRGRVDVARIARQLTESGGGHRNAAGALFDGDLDTCEAALVAIVGAALQGEAAAS